MVNVSKKYLEENFKNSIWRNFRAEIEKTNSEKEFKKVLDKYFTITEQIMLEKRLAILDLLKDGLSYRKIKETLDVSHDTISSVKNGFLKIKKPPSKKHRGHPMLKRLRYKKSPSRFPVYKGKGRWRFLDVSR